MKVKNVEDSSSPFPPSPAGPPSAPSSMPRRQENAEPRPDVTSEAALSLRNSNSGRPDTPRQSCFAGSVSDGKAGGSPNREFSGDIQVQVE
jgi:hypothetical protein